MKISSTIMDFMVSLRRKGPNKTAAEAGTGTKTDRRSESGTSEDKMCKMAGFRNGRRPF